MYRVFVAAWASFCSSLSICVCCHDMCTANFTNYTVFFHYFVKRDVITSQVLQDLNLNILAHICCIGLHCKSMKIATLYSPVT